MKANKKYPESNVLHQLSEKIKDSDFSKNRDTNELREEIFMILGKKRINIKIPKNSKLLTNLSENTY